MAPPRKLKLPASLLQELNEQPSSSARGRGRGTKPVSRKEQRKAQRVQKKQARSAPRRQAEAAVASKPRIANPIQRRRDASDDGVDVDEDEDLGLEDDEDLDLDNGPEDDESDGTASEANGQEASTAPEMPKSVRRKLDEDDAEIAALEKKLGLKKGKKSKALDEDGLGDLLGDLNGGEDGYEEDTESKKRKAEADEWLAQKRRKAKAAVAVAAAAAAPTRAPASRSADGNDDEDVDEDSDRGDEDQEDDGLSELGDSDLEREESENSEGDDDGFEGFSDAEETSAPRQKENPYVAPTTGVAKYVPPSLRKQQSQSSEEIDAQLRRRVQGLINRLTSESMIGIIKDFSGLYDGFPRQSVTSALVSLVITLVCAPERRPDSFFTMMAGFIAGAQKALGVHVSANLVQQLVETFKERHEAASGDQSDAGSKHLIALLAELYNFQVVGSNLLFDYIRMFLNNLSELNTELLLRIIQVCGPSLRREDPQSLKDVVSHMKPSSLKDVSVRTSFMIDEMKKLQSNKANATTRNRGKDLAEQRTHIRKRIGTLSGSTRDIQPLRMSLKEIENADKNGKWWVVGASWSGNREKDEPKSDNNNNNDNDAEDDADSLTDFEINDDLGIPDLRQLAWEQGFNTEVRQNICIALHNCSNAKQAEQNILKLRLNKHQRKEIPEVIVRCAESQLQPKPFYWLVASRFTGEKELAFQFKRCLTSRFRQMGEDIDTGGDDEMDAEDPEEYENLWLFNIGKFYGTLVAKGYLGLDLLKHRNLAALRKKTRDFVEVFLITVLQEAKTDDALQKVFGRLGPEMARSVLYFLKKHVQKTDLLEKKQKRAIVQKAVEAEDILEASLNASASEA